MMTELEQKRFFSKKKFKLKKYEVEIYDKKIDEELEYTINYLELGVKTVKKTTKSSAFLELFFWAFFIMQLGLLIQSLIFECENTGMIIYWSLGSGLFLGFIFLIRYQPGKKLIYMTGGQKSIELFQEKPNKKEVKLFIEELKNRIKQAYLNEYLKWENSTPKEQKIGQLEWLKQIKILEETEFDKLVQKINTGKPIGFDNE